MNTKKHVCPLCDYIYDETLGDESLAIVAGTPFENLPEDFKHPHCSGSKAEFETCTCAGLEEAVRS